MHRHAGSGSPNGPRCSIAGVREARPDGLLNRDRFAGRRVGTILTGSNTTTGDFARRVPATSIQRSVGNDNGPCWCD